MDAVMLSCLYDEGLCRGPDYDMRPRFDLGIEG